MRKSSRYVDPSSMVVIVLTLILFVAAIWIKGFTHELLLETGVFLVSAKLILMGHKNAVTAQSIHDKLDRIDKALQTQEIAESRGKDDGKMN